MTAPRIAIFDFDGTLADSFALVLAQYNRLAPRFRARPVDVAQLDRLRDMKPQALLQEHNVQFWKLPLLAHAMRSAMRAHVASVEPCAGVVPALAQLTQHGVRCSILSTNSRENIKRFLDRHDLRFFQHVAGGSSLFGKARALHKLIEQAPFERELVYYVGDEARDIQAAKAASVRSIAVSWGYASRESLAAQGPDHLVDRPEELVALLTGARDRASVPHIRSQ